MSECVRVYLLARELNIYDMSAVCTYVCMCVHAYIGIGVLVMPIRVEI